MRIHVGDKVEREPEPEPVIEAPARSRIIEADFEGWCVCYAPIKPGDLVRQVNGAWVHIDCHSLGHRNPSKVPVSDG